MIEEYPKQLDLAEASKMFQNWVRKSRDAERAARAVLDAHATGQARRATASDGTGTN